MASSRVVGLDEPNKPEDDAEQEGADGQDEAACHPHLACAHNRHLPILLLSVSRLHPDHANLVVSTKVGRTRLLEDLVEGVEDHLKEGDGHCEHHPNVDHLDVICDWQCLRESKKPGNEKLMVNKKQMTYIVARTSRMVRLT